MNQIEQHSEKPQEFLGESKAQERLMLVELMGKREGGRKRKRKTSPCENCGTIILQYPSQKQRFCSWKCKTDPVWRFWRFVEKTDSCWIWNGGKNAGYGIFSKGNKSRIAHRVSYEMHFGPIPENTEVCHRCDNPSCVRPDHLFLGTAKDNSDDKFSKGRQRYTGPKSKEEVARIRSDACSLTREELCRKYNIQPPSLLRILNRKTHQDL